MDRRIARQRQTGRLQLPEFVRTGNYEEEEEEHGKNCQWGRDLEEVPG